MEAKRAVDWVDPIKWRDTSAEKKLEFLKEIQQRIKTYQAELDMHGLKRDDDENVHQVGEFMQGPVPIATNVVACIEVYESLVKGEMPQPLKIEQVTDDLYDIHVSPRNAMDRMLHAGQVGILRVKGEPKQTNPLEKEGGIVAILGAGNFTAAFEMIRALLIDNCVVVHKAHHVNLGVDAVWEKVFKPLVDYRALSYVDKGGRDLVKDERLKKIYFTGGAPAAKAIMASTDTEFVSECGGNNPIIIVPGDAPWTKSQIRHHATVIATIGKSNGGAVRGRGQTLVTSRNWPQRRESLDALYVALANDTPAFTSYYPNSDKVFAGFQENCPDAKVIEPEGNAILDSRILLIEDVREESFATSHEAFTQVFGEVALDTPAKADVLLEQAVEFCNTKLVGTLGSSIIIDDRPAKKYKEALDDAITKMEYGAIGINVIPPMIWVNPYLTWVVTKKGKNSCQALAISEMP